LVDAFLDFFASHRTIVRLCYSASLEAPELHREVHAMFAELEALGRDLLGQVAPAVPVDPGVAIFVMTNAFIASVVDEPSQTAFLGSSIFTSPRARDRLSRRAEAHRARRIHGHVTKMGEPTIGAGLPAGPRLPAIVQGLWFVARPVQYFERCRQRFGDPFTIHLPTTPPVVLFSDPAAIREIFTGDEDTLRAGEATVVLQPILGPNSLLLIDGERHLRERRMMMPPFHGDRMRAYGETMRDVTEAALATWPVGQPFPLLGGTQAITLDVIVRTVFGLNDGAAMERLRDRLRRFVASAVNPLYLWRALQVDLGPFSPWGRFVRLRREIDALLDVEIDGRRSAGVGERNDVLQLLLAARDEAGEPMSRPQLRDELMTLLLAGHETTATGLAWTMHRVLTEAGVLDSRARRGGRRHGLRTRRDRRRRAARVSRRGRQGDAPLESGDPRRAPTGEAADADRRRRPAGGRRRRAEHPRGAPPAGGLARARPVPSRALRRHAPEPVRVLSVRGRKPPVSRHGVRALRDESRPGDAPRAGRFHASARLPRPGRPAEHHLGPVGRDASRPGAPRRLKKRGAIGTL